MWLLSAPESQNHLQERLGRVLEERKGKGKKELHFYLTGEGEHKEKKGVLKNVARSLVR